LRSSTLDSLHTGVSPGSIGCAYTYSGPFRERADIYTTTLGIPPSNPDPVPVTCRTVHLLLERKQNSLIWSQKIFNSRRSFPFWPKNYGTKQSNLICSGNYLWQSRKFLFNPKTKRLKQNVLIWFANYRNENKTL
jgi:hypothetical protein